MNYVNILCVRWNISEHSLKIFIFIKMLYIYICVYVIADKLQKQKKKGSKGIHFFWNSYQIKREWVKKIILNNKMIFIKFSA